MNLSPTHKICLAVFFLAIFIFLALILYKNADLLIVWINTLGIFAPLFFLGIYCLATLMFLPTLFFSMAGGALFGPLGGAFFNVLGASIGASIAFIISRHFLFECLSKKQYPKTSQLIEGVEQWGWPFIALLRLVPIIPFNVVNYGLGLTKIKFSEYILTTALFLIPAEILITYCGYKGMDILLQSSEFYKKLVLAGLFTLGLLYIVFKACRLKQKI